MDTTTLIAVIGGSAVNAETAAIAEQVGRELATQQVGVVCGGLTGVMEAACKGASDAGGLTVGIMPSARIQDANRYVQIAIPTGMGHLRNALVVRAGRAVIAIDGSYGTLSEIAYALNEGIPVVAIDSWEIGTGGRPDKAIRRAATPREAVALAIKLARERDDL